MRDDHAIRISRVSVLHHFNWVILHMICKQSVADLNDAHSGKPKLIGLELDDFIAAVHF